MVLLVLT